MINEQKMISIIVPVYNVENCVYDSVKSIMNQTYKNLEIILVDDGSTDNSGKVCDYLEEIDERITVIHQINKGLATARNTGIKNANGEYIGFVDSDDKIDCKMFERLVNLITKNNADLAICGFKKIYDIKTKNKTNYSENYTILNKKGLLDEIIINLNNAAWNKLYKTSIVKKVNFPIGIIHGEDLLFLIDYTKYCNSAVFIDDELYFYFQRQGSITKTGYTIKSIDEVKVKDILKTKVEKEYPEYIPIANLYCFRSRMNLIRKIYLSKKEKSENIELNKLTKYIFDNYSNIKNKLTVKEKMEIFIYKYMRFIYRYLIEVQRRIHEVVKRKR